MRRLCLLLCFLLSPLSPLAAAAPQALPSLHRLNGLRSSQGQGSLKAATYLPDGSAVLLYDQADGVRLLKTDATGSTLLSEAHQGAAGDQALCLSADGQGNVYVGGTSFSGQLFGTAGAFHPTPVDTSINSFIAKFDKDLHLVFLTFLGADQTALSGLAATHDAVFVTGVTYGSRFPVTAGALQPSPVTGSTGNGFVQRFSADGSSLQYSTYLGGEGGTTTPATVVADILDNAYVAGSTSAPAFPTVGALQPFMLGTVSGFVAKLTPAGDVLAFSTFIAGSGISSLALDPATSSLLLTGDVALDRFPVANVPGPLADTAYQTLLRLAIDGSSLQDSALLFPGAQSSVTAGPNGDIWATGPLATPLSTLEQHAGVGDAYAVHLTATDSIDRALRLGGVATDNAPYATLRTFAGPPALNPNATSVLLTGTVSVLTDPSVVTSQSFDFALSPGTTSLFPVSDQQLLPTVCAAGQPCGASAGFLAKLAPGQNGAALAVSSGDLPTLTVRNKGVATATGVAVTSQPYTLTTTCSGDLAPGEQCGIMLRGSGAGTVTLSAANVPAQTLAIASLPFPPFVPLILSRAELDFGIVTPDSPGTETFTVTNLDAKVQTFASEADGLPSAAPYQLSETASTCPGSSGAHVLSPGISCTVTLTLSLSASDTSTGPVRAAWKVGPRDLLITGFTQASPVSLSATHIDFGPQVLPPGTRLPRYLYLSNASRTAVAHSSLRLPENAPFQLIDSCPFTLAPQSICQLTLTYTQQATPAVDSTTLTLDDGLTVLVTGETVLTSLSSSPQSSPFLVSTATLLFPTPIPVTRVSAETQTVQITNRSPIAQPLTATLLGDFLLTGTCGNTVQPGSTCSIATHFVPSQTGVRQGQLTLSAGPNFRSTEVTLAGTATPLLPLESTPIDLGDVMTGEPVVRWLQLKAVLPTLRLQVDPGAFGVAILGDSGNGHGTLPASAFHASAVAACSRCWVALQFWPQQPGAAQTALQITTDQAGSPYQVTLRGSALAAQSLLLTPSQVDFGPIAVNSASEPKQLTLTSLLPVSIRAELNSIAATGDFTVLPASQGCPAILLSSTSCAVQVAFKPTAQGARSGVLTVTTSAGTVSTALLGLGIPDPGLAISPASLTFATSASQTLIFQNTTAMPVTVGLPSTSSTAFQVSTSCQSLAPQQSCTVSVTYAPQTTSVTSSITIPVSYTDATGQAATKFYAVPVTGGASSGTAGLTVFPPQSDFGTVGTGTLGPLRQFVLTNTSTQPLTVSFAASHNFPLAAVPDCGLLAPLATCAFSVLFIPETAGSLSGSVALTAAAPDGSVLAQTTLYTQGYATSAGTITLSAGTSPSSPLDFGQVASGDRLRRSLTLTNSGTLPVHVRRLATTASFTAASNCTQLNPAASCTLTVTYAPQYQLPPNALVQPRADTGLLTLETDAASSPDTLYLAGIANPSTTGSGNTALPTYTLSETAHTFPDTAPGTSSPVQTLTLRNTASLPFTIAGIVTSPEFPVTSDCSTVQPSASCTLSIAFTPASDAAQTVHSAVIGITSNAANALEFLSVLGYAAATPLQVSAGALTFPSVPVGSAAQLALSFHNTTALPLSLGHVTTVGDFGTATGTCPANGGILAAGDSCSFLVTFTPTATGARTGALTLASAGLPTPLRVTLTGYGIAGHLESDLVSANFGTLVLSTTATQVIHLTDTGNADLTRLNLNLTGPDAPFFGVSSTCPQALSPNAACEAVIAFTPSHPGPYSATLLLASSDPAGPASITLFGTGEETPGFLLTVQGTDSASATLSSGGLWAFPFVLTPKGGFDQPVTLTCTPLSPAPNALCSLTATTLTLANGPASGVATISTASGILSASLAPLEWLLLPLCLLNWKGRAHQRSSQLSILRSVLIFTGLAAGMATLLGCAGSTGYTGAPYTPAGTYTYRVTASSTQGVPLSSAITLTIKVQ